MIDAGWIVGDRVTTDYMIICVVFLWLLLAPAYRFFVPGADPRRDARRPPGDDDQDDDADTST